MSIHHTESFLLETLRGIHDFATDEIKIALFNSSASFSRDTTTYSTANEISTGNGYTTGGETLVAVSGYPQIEAGGAAVRYEDVTWAFTSVKGNVQWALIYNASKSNRAILSINMGNARDMLGQFDFRFPLSAPPVIYQKAPL